MAGENAASVRQTQIGVQATLFTGVTANILLPSISIQPMPVVANQMLYRQGDKIGIAQVATKGSQTTAKMTGFASFPDLAYIFSNLLKAATITTPGGATNARDWDWILLSRSLEAPKMWSVENGIAGTDYSRFKDAVLVMAKFAFEQNKEVTLEGDMIGGNLAEEGVTPTATPTELPKVPCSMNIMDAYVADDLSSFAGGHLGTLYKADFTIGDRRSPVFPIRSDRPSFGGFTEKRNKVLAHIEVEHDAQSYAMMRQMRFSNMRYLRFFLTGMEIEPGYNYELEIIMPFKVTNPQRGIMDEVYGGMYDLEAIEDATLGGFAHIRLRTGLASLTAGGALAGGQDPDTLIAGLSAVGNG